MILFWCPVHVMMRWPMQGYTFKLLLVLFSLLLCVISSFLILETQNICVRLIDEVVFVNAYQNHVRCRPTVNPSSCESHSEDDALSLV
jgi:hypothetical protein